MTQPQIPSFPHARVTMLADGSAHLNVAGRHTDYPPGPPAGTRAAVLADAAQLADQLGRPIRMTTVDPDGEWLIAVHPDGTAVELVGSAVKPRRRREPVSAPAAGATRQPARDTVSIAADAMQRIPHAAATPDARPEPPAPVDVPPLEEEVEETRIAQRPPQRLALLQFSTGQSVVVDGPIVAGRRPAAEPGHRELKIVDETLTVSKTHFTLEFRGAELWITDCHSGNGVRVRRTNERERKLEPGTPSPVAAGDQVHIGEIHFLVSIETTTRA